MFFGGSAANGTEQTPGSHRGADFGCCSAPLFGEGLREHHNPGHRERAGRPYERRGVPPLQVQGGDHGCGGGSYVF